MMKKVLADNFILNEFVAHLMNFEVWSNKVLYFYLSNFGRCDSHVVNFGLQIFLLKFKYASVDFSGYNLLSTVVRIKDLGFCSIMSSAF